MIGSSWRILVLLVSLEEQLEELNAEIVRLLQLEVQVEHDVDEALLRGRVKSVIEEVSDLQEELGAVDSIS